MWEQLAAAINAKNITEAQNLITSINQSELSKVDRDGNTVLMLAGKNASCGITKNNSVHWNGLEKVSELLISKMSNLAINVVAKDGYTALTWAASAGWIKICEPLIFRMSEQTISAIATNGNTTLIFASMNGLEKICELLLPKMNDQSINSVGSQGFTALTPAASRGSEKIFELLLPKMNSEAINFVSNNGYTNLTWAAAKGSEKICELLIPKMNEKAINVIAEDGYTALMRAAHTGSNKICELLIPRMSEQAISAINYNSETALILAASKGKYSEKICELLIPRMSEKAINHVNKDGNTALILAVGAGDGVGLERICELLIPRMSEQSINCLGKAGYTAMDIAISKGYIRIIPIIKPPQEYENKEFTSNKDKGNTKPEISINPSSITEEEIIKELPNKIIEISKFQQLIFAIKSEDTKSAARLIIQMTEKELNEVDKEGRTVLHWAIEKCNEKIVAILLKKNPSLISVEDHNNNKPLILAELLSLTKDSDYSKIIELLKNITGGSLGVHEHESYWHEYSKVAMDKILELRLEATGIEKENFKIMSPNYVWDGYENTAEKLSKEILTDLLKVSKQVLIFLNLHNKHWVGISINKTDKEIKINYLDSEQNKVPVLLKNALTEKIATAYPNCEVILSEKVLELQKSNNCGSEVVENLVFEATGHRVDQESAIVMHSLLYEDSLLGENGNLITF
ncbi:ankyrin repeat domain-containing protein [Rickettsia endosymbiont of Ceutorhynchus obstrictus]|uniref:ankyrin repeat domain-containing protein n=1 Tax=Rickettsia endosymbiont of Ceutorhynchus obstrictus TaxID=3066249 RepID=UPI003133418C